MPPSEIVFVVAKQPNTTLHFNHLFGETEKQIKFLRLSGCGRVQKSRAQLTRMQCDLCVCNPGIKLIHGRTFH